MKTRPSIAVLLLLAGTARAQPMPPQLNIVNPLPPHAPAWVEGFQIRWPVRVLGTPAQMPESQSVMVTLPTGGWLKADASDLAVQAANGKLLPLAVLSHDPAGET